MPPTQPPTTGPSTATASLPRSTEPIFQSPEARPAVGLRLKRLPFDSDDALVAAIDGECAECPRFPGKRVDIDAVGPDLGLRDGRMPMHDHLRVKPGMVVKDVADPDQVLLVLAVEGYVRPYPGMA